MDSNAAERTIMLSGLITFGLGWFGAAEQGHLPTPRFVIGAGMAFLTLSVVADFAPEVAGPLALAIVTTAFFTEGSGVFGYINQAQGKGKPTSTTTGKAPANAPVNQRKPKANPGAQVGASIGNAARHIAG